MEFINTPPYGIPFVRNSDLSRKLNLSEFHFRAKRKPSKAVANDRQVENGNIPSKATPNIEEKTAVSTEPESRASSGSDSDSGNKKSDLDPYYDPAMTDQGVTV